VGVRALLPLTGASAKTIDALASFVADFPHPTHPFTIDVSAVSPITPQSIEEATDRPARLVSLLKRLTITASYTGTFKRPLDILMGTREYQEFRVLFDRYLPMMMCNCWM
jgi:hypothetical protein